MKKPKNVFVTIAVLAVVVTGVYYFDHVWCWLASELESGFETSRNIALILAALIGLPLAIWRSWVAHKQSETSERGLRNERFQKSADMLGSKTFTVRMGGIYALGRLAQDHPEDYLDQVIKLLAAFVRCPAYDEETAKLVESGKTDKRPFRRDVRDAVLIISELNSQETVKHDPSEKDNMPDLSGSNLIGMIFTKVNLTRMNFTGVQFVKAILISTNLTGADLFGADLTNANLTGATLTNADLTRTNISGAIFIGVEGLSQEQLNKACQSPDKPPKNLPLGLTWDEKTAVERWHDTEKFNEWFDNNYLESD